MSQLTDNLSEAIEDAAICEEYADLILRRF